MFASESAKVVIDELGAQVGGNGADVGPAQDAVNEITANGGETVVNGGDVSNYGITDVRGYADRTPDTTAKVFQALRAS